MELDLYGLAVCAIMSSGELDAEGLTTLAMAGGSAGSGSGAAGAVSQVCFLFLFLLICLLWCNVLQLGKKGITCGVRISF